MNFNADALASSSINPTPTQEKFAQVFGVNWELFNNSSNHGFIDFVESNALHKKMAQFGHQIQVVGSSLELKFEGRMTKWSEIREKIEANVIKTTATGKLIDTYYTHVGLKIAPNLTNINIDEMTIDELMEKAAVVFKEEDPASWNHEFVISFVTQSHSDGPKRAKVHSWFHFKHPDGRVLSLGLYRMKPALEVQPGRIERVDDYEAYQSPDGVRDECDIRVTKEQWEAQLKKLLKKTQKGVVPYHQLHKTCVTIVSKVMNAVTGSKFFDGSIHISDLLTPFQQGMASILPQSAIDLIFSGFVSDAGESMDLATLSEHEVVITRVNTLSVRQKLKVQERLNHVALRFAEKTASEQVIIHHPYKLRILGLRIAAYRLQVIDGLKNRFQKMIDSTKENTDINDQDKQKEIQELKEVFSISKSSLKFALPPESWKVPSTLPEAHPDYDAIELDG